MVKSIEFREGVLRLTVTSSSSAAAGKCDGSIEFDLGQSRAISKLHSRELMDFVDAIDPERADKIGNLIVKLLDTHPRVCRIDFYSLDSASESLEGGTATDEQIKLARGTV